MVRNLSSFNTKVVIAIGGENPNVADTSQKGGQKSGQGKADLNPNYPSATGNPSGKGRGNDKK